MVRADPASADARQRMNITLRLRVDCSKCAEQEHFTAENIKRHRQALLNSSCRVSNVNSTVLWPTNARAPQNAQAIGSRCYILSDRAGGGGGAVVIIACGAADKEPLCGNEQVRRTAAVHFDVKNVWKSFWIILRALNFILPMISIGKLFPGMF